MSGRHTDPHFFAGEVLGDRLLLRLLRVNHRGEVWYGCRRSTGEPAVFKLIRRTPDRTPRLNALADLLRHSRCRQLIGVRDFTEEGEYLLAEMEYAAGGTLRAALKRLHRFTAAQAAFILRETLTALDELHRHGIVHRDVKTGNLWLTGSGEVRLGDFGIAKIDGFPERSPAVFGTPSALSPEQAEDSTRVDCRSDLFSLSSMIFELLTGYPRFSGTSLTAAARQILAADPAQMADRLRPFAPAALIALLTEMAAPRPDRRPANAGEALRIMEDMQLPEEAIPL